MDSSTEFLFGLSANTQICAMVRESKMDAKPQIVDMDGFEEAFKRVQTHVGMRMKVIDTLDNIFFSIRLTPLRLEDPTGW